MDTVMEMFDFILFICVVLMLELLLYFGLSEHLDLDLRFRIAGSGLGLRVM